MWRETPYVIIGAHEPGRENKLVVCGPSTVLKPDWQVDILDRDPDTGKVTGANLRIIFTKPELMRKFGETLLDAAKKWEEINGNDNP